MKKETAFRVHQPAQGQTKEEARSILRHCIDQLATTSVGDPDWTDATNLLGQIDPEFAPIQLNALADERQQVCRALSVALSRIGPSILDDVVQTVGHEHPRARKFACGLIYGLHQRVRRGIPVRLRIPWDQRVRCPHCQRVEDPRYRVLLSRLLLLLLPPENL